MAWCSLGYNYDYLVVAGGGGGGGGNTGPGGKELVEVELEVIELLVTVQAHYKIVQYFYPLEIKDAITVGAGGAGGAGVGPAGYKSWYYRS